jgi:uncharacterized protein (DUF934 family)
MALWKNGEFMTDVWTRIADDQPLPDLGYGLIGLQRWITERSSILSRRVPIGLWLTPADDLALVEADIRHFAVIALEFPSFTDGRAYSTARLIRERYQFGGELRAVGDVLIDQIAFMQRVGFDAFTVTNEATVAGLLAGNLPDVPYYLQPAIGRHEIPAGTRPWARRSVPG